MWEREGPHPEHHGLLTLTNGRRAAVTLGANIAMVVSTNMLLLACIAKSLLTISVSEVASGQPLPEGSPANGI
jgi:hypothetical protein